MAEQIFCLLMGGMIGALVIVLIWIIENEFHKKKNKKEVHRENETSKTDAGTETGNQNYVSRWHFCSTDSDKVQHK